MAETVDYQTCVKELVTLLCKAPLTQTSRICIEQLMGLTGVLDIIPFMIEEHEFLLKLVELADRNDDMALMATTTLVNISAVKDGPEAIMALNNTDCSNPEAHCAKILGLCIRNIADAQSFLADGCTMLLCNLTRNTSCLNTLASNIDTDMIGVLVNVFCNVMNTKPGKFDLLAMIFSNITQCPAMRRLILDHLKKLLPFTEYKGDEIRRCGIVATIKNLTFDIENHKILLDPNGVNVLPHVLLPLAGPEEFDEDDMEKLPIELQYLPEEKQREPVASIRVILLETLMQFCATAEGRKYMRDKNVYVILRELHSREIDQTVLHICENVVNILLRTEDEIGVNNYYDIPHEVEHSNVEPTCHAEEQNPDQSIKNKEQIQQQHALDIQCLNYKLNKVTIQAENYQRLPHDTDCGTQSHQGE